MTQMLPDEMRGGIAPYVLADENSVEYKLVKAADRLSAYIKCIEELKAGNQEFESAARQTEQALNDLDMPCLRYFMEHCLDSFRLNLDELE